MADDVAEVATREFTKELGFLPWFTKIIERGNIVLDCVKSRCDIKQEDDWAIIEMLHRDWFLGEHILYETISVPDLSKNMTQPSLFDDKTAISVTATDNFDDARDIMLDGKEIVPSESKPKSKKK